MKNKANTNTKMHNKRIRKGITVSIILIALIVISTTIIILLHQPTHEENPLNQEVAISEKSIVDYNQKITSIDGKDAKTSYELGTRSDYSVRFPNLTCSEQCANVKNLKINNQNLTAGEDYEVKSGSVIITILHEYMETLKIGEYELTFEITSDDKKSTIGFNFTITDNIPTCTETQKLKDNKCIEKKTEQSTASNIQKPSTNNTTSHNITTNWDGVPLVDYSTGVAAYNIPSPSLNSRASFNATNGWEHVAFNMYHEYLMNIKGGGEPLHTMGQNELCFSSVTFDFDNMEIRNLSWDNSPTSTCDKYRNENPPIPSEYYLTNLYRKIAASDCYLNNVNWMYCRNPQW